MLKIHNVLESFGHNFAITNAEDYLQNLDKQAKVHDLEKHIDQLVYNFTTSRQRRLRLRTRRYEQNR